MGMLQPLMQDLLLIPGFMCTSALWDDMRASLGQLGRIHHADLSLGTSIKEYAQQVLSQAPERFLLIGFSMGGYVAREIALLAGERVQGLVLISTSARGTPPDEQALNVQRVRLAQHARFNGLSREAIERALAPSRRQDTAIIERIRGMSRALGKDVFIRQLGIVREDGLLDCGRIACPALVVACDSDQLRSLDEAQEMAAALPDAQLEILKDCGHMAPLEAPGRLSEVIEYWIRSR